MERMTKRTSDGQVVMDCKKCKADWTEKHGESMEECTALYCRNRLKDRVAAYEDTRLAPAEVRSMYGEWNAMMSVLNSIGSYARLRKLAAADKDRRVVVLPCNVGDVLWTFYNFPLKKVYSCTVTDVSYLNGKIVLNTDLCGTIAGDNIGKTVFLTHEEAKKTLEAKRNEGM